MRWQRILRFDAQLLASATAGSILVLVVIALSPFKMPKRSERLTPLAQISDAVFPIRVQPGPILIPPCPAPTGLDDLISAAGFDHHVDPSFGLAPDCPSALERHPGFGRPQQRQPLIVVALFQLGHVRPFNLPLRAFSNSTRVASAIGLPAASQVRRAARPSKALACIRHQRRQKR
jgi:hypothetical protein